MKEKIAFWFMRHNQEICIATILFVQIFLIWLLFFVGVIDQYLLGGIIAVIFVMDLSAILALIFYEA